MQQDRAQHSGERVRRDVTGVAFLRVADGAGGPVLRYPLEGRRWTIGRAGDAEVHLDHHTVSRRHAELRLCPLGRWWIHDLDSTNGTLLNGRRVTSEALAPGDEIGVGCFGLRVEHRELPFAGHIGVGPTPIDTVPFAALDDSLSVLPEPIDQPRIGVAQLDAVTALERALMSIQSSVERQNRLGEMLIEDFGVRRAGVLRIKSDFSVHLVGRPFGEDAETLTTSLSGSVIKALWRQRSAVVGCDARRLETAPAAELPNVGSVIACPLLDEVHHMDAIYVELKSGEPVEEWRALIRLIAIAFEQIELVWRMRRQVRSAALVEAELETARKLQRQLIPLNTRFDHIELAMGYQPCYSVGGDYVDVIRLPTGNLLLVVADVCGKGLQGALVTSCLHALVQATVDGGETVSQLVSRMNRYLSRHLPDHSFVTLVALELDPLTGEIECVNAGHPPPLVVTVDGRVRALATGDNVALAIVDEPFASTRTQLEPGELLLLYTDGYIELMDEERQPLGSERFNAGVGRVVAGNVDAPVRALEEQLRRMVDDVRGAQLATDDFAFIIVQRSDEIVRERVA